MCTVFFFFFPLYFSSYPAGGVVGFVEIYFRQPSIIIIAAARLAGSFPPLSPDWWEGRSRRCKGYNSWHYQQDYKRWRSRTCREGRQTRKKKNKPSRRARCQDVGVIDATSSPVANAIVLLARLLSEGELWSAHGSLYLIKRYGKNTFLTTNQILVDKSST